LWVWSRIEALGEPLDGITLTGGEPFDQAAALAELLEHLARSKSQWNVMAFSGYPLTHLEKGGDAERRLVSLTDVLVAGPYVEGLPATHPLTASGNQRVHYLTPRGDSLRAECEALPFNRANYAYGRDGQDVLIGILSSTAREHLHHTLGLRRERRFL
jgi:anaerobic ribonucleoside-triphosphate reductase activating protein